MTITTVALTDTFDVWRTRTNQLVTQSNYYETNLPTYATLAGANTAVGAGANAFSAATIAGANTAVGAGANAFSAATIAGANTAVGAGANSYANVVWARANSRMDSLSTLTGTEANNFTKATLNGANTAARDATNLTSGTVPSARISGSYTGITGVGTIDTGVWNATDISLAAGGTGATLTGVAGAVVYSGSSAMALTLAGTSGQVLTSAGTSAPTWSNGLPVTSIPNAANLNTYTTPGSYHQSADAQAAAGTNYPVALAGLLEVYASSVMVYQRYTVYNSGRIYTRSNYNGTWYSWLTTLDSSNYNSYAPTLTGTGASGTSWGISITGSAGSAGTFTSTSQNSQFNSIGVGTGASGTAGTITATGDITAFSSDARLKGDIRTITDALSKVKLITGVTYVHNDIAKSFGYTDESRLAGVLAQEVEAVLPEVVVPAPFDVADDGTSKSGKNYKTVKYEKIVPLLIEAIKELTAKVEMLESRVNE
jgi:hypothetical protein